MGGCLYQAWRSGIKSSIDRQDWEILTNRCGPFGQHQRWACGHVRLAGRLVDSTAVAAIRPIGLEDAITDAARIGAVFAATLYALLAGWGVPAQRTVIMMAVFAALRVSGRRWPWPGDLGVGCCGGHRLGPFVFVPGGVLVVICAVGVLMTMAPESESELGRNAAQGWLAQLFQLGRQNGRPNGVTVALLPLSFVCFQQASLMGFARQLVYDPCFFTALITPLALLGALMPGLWNGALR